MVVAKDGVVLNLSFKWLVQLCLSSPATPRTTCAFRRRPTRSHSWIEGNYPRTSILHMAHLSGTWPLTHHGQRPCRALLRSQHDIDFFICSFCARVQGVLDCSERVEIMAGVRLYGIMRSGGLCGAVTVAVDRRGIAIVFGMQIRNI